MKNIEKGLTFDDVVLVPGYSNIESRKTVDLSTAIGDIRLTCPIISSNMDTITGFDMAREMSRLGGLGLLHRYQSPDKVKEIIKRLKDEDCKAVPSIGVKEEDFKIADQYIKLGINGICVDVAHGHNENVGRMVNYLRKSTGNLTVIAGNVATANGACFLASHGASAIRVGIGNGSLCSTRVVTGHGVPQITALIKIREEIDRWYPSVSLISDGGAKSSGDCVKALAAGADAIMTGSLLAGCRETPEIEGQHIYRGMASREAKQAFYGSTEKWAPEGEAARNVKDKGFVKDVIHNLITGMKSGLSYSGARDIKTLQSIGEFMEVTNSGYIEGTPHFLRNN